jgi:ammonium transporter, Amt family
MIGYSIPCRLPPVAAILALLLVAFAGTAPSVAAEVSAETSAAAAPPGEPPESVESLGARLSTLAADADTLWTCLAAFLVFFMHAGFAMVETGFTRAKNACNILMKNFMNFSLGSLTFWMIGFGLMFGATTTGWFGTTGFFYDAGENGFHWAFLLFQTVFCATSATIVSGAMAERTKFPSFLIFVVLITTLVYPVFGSWVWGSLFHGEGWLERLGFHDFAGSTVVHSIGGWAALAGVLVLGPRIGKYSGKRTTPVPGHNIPLAALGVFILWLGWFGFNPGSTTAVGGGSFARIAVATNLSGAAGAVAGMVLSWVLFRKPDPSFALNGALAGLVAITAGCDVIPVHYAALVGLLAGMVVVVACLAFDRLQIDDPVGAISVHGVCGALGTLCVGLFHEEAGLLVGGGAAMLATQSIGVAAAFLWAFPTSLGIFLAIKHTVGLRVGAEEEIEGLDLAEHGIYAYPPSFVTGVDASTATAELPAVHRLTPMAETA